MSLLTVFKSNIPYRNKFALLFHHVCLFMLSLKKSYFNYNLVGVSRKAEDNYPISAPGPCYQFLVESVLLIGLCTWNAFFWFMLEPWFPWLLFYSPGSIQLLVEKWYIWLQRWWTTLYYIQMWYKKF